MTSRVGFSKNTRHALAHPALGAACGLGCTPPLTNWIRPWNALELSRPGSAASFADDVSGCRRPQVVDYRGEYVCKTCHNYGLKTSRGSVLQCSHTLHVHQQLVEVIYPRSGWVFVLCCSFPLFSPWKSAKPFTKPSGLKMVTRFSRYDRYTADFHVENWFFAAPQQDRSLSSHASHGCAGAVCMYLQGSDKVASNIPGPPVGVSNICFL